MVILVYLVWTKENIKHKRHLAQVCSHISHLTLAFNKQTENTKQVVTTDRLIIH